MSYDTLGYPHALYRNNGNLCHLYKDVSGWHYELLVSSIGCWQRIVIGPDNVYHVIYNANGAVYYMRHTNSGWSIPVVIGSPDNQGYYGDACGALALDSDNRPHIVHLKSNSPNRIEHIWWDGNSWQ